MQAEHLEQRGEQSEAPLELPEYPPLPMRDGRLVLDELDAWSVQKERRHGELQAALHLVDAGSAPATDRPAILARLDEFSSLWLMDFSRLRGFIDGRFEFVVGPGLPLRGSPAYNEGRAAGLRESADRMAELGAAAECELRDRAHTLKAQRCPHCGSSTLDRGFTGLDACSTCGGLSCSGRTLSSFEATR